MKVTLQIGRFVVGISFSWDPERGAVPSKREQVDSALWIRRQTARDKVNWSKRDDPKPAQNNPNPKCRKYK